MVNLDNLHLRFISKVNDREIKPPSIPYASVITTPSPRGFNHVLPRVCKYAHLLYQLPHPQLRKYIHITSLHLLEEITSKLKSPGFTLTSFLLACVGSQLSNLITIPTPLVTFNTQSLAKHLQPLSLE